MTASAHQRSSSSRERPRSCTAHVRGRGKADVSRFLLTRVIWLVLLELTVMRFAWTFTFDVASYSLAGVIWVIGWCMMLMSLLVHLPRAVVGALASRSSSATTRSTSFFRADPRLPTGSMGAWVALARAIRWRPVYDRRRRTEARPALFDRAVDRRHGGRLHFWTRAVHGQRASKRICLAIGLGAVDAFLKLRWFNLYGKARPWGGPVSQLPPLFSFLNTTKYPAWLLHLIMTLGPTIASLPLLERASGWLANVLTVSGRVPVFYFALHIPVIHLVVVAISLVRTPQPTAWLFGNHPFDPPPVPDGYAYGLPIMYLVWLLVVVALTCLPLVRRVQGEAERQVAELPMSSRSVA
jgi:hypothetical protein